MAYRRGNNYRRSSFDPYCSRPDGGPYNSAGRRPLPEDYSSTTDRSSFDRSQFNPYGSTDRRSSQDLRNSQKSLFDTPSDQPYGSADRELSKDTFKSRISSLFDTPSVDRYGSTDRSSFQRPQFNPSASKDIDFTQDIFDSGQSSSFDTPSSNSIQSFNPVYNSSSDRPPFKSYGRGGRDHFQSSNPYRPNINKSRANQGYSSYESGSFPQTTNFEKEENKEDFERYHSSEEVLGNLNSSERPGNSLVNSKQAEDSDDDDDGDPITNLNSDENLMKYIDRMLSAKQNNLQEAIQNYNALVRKFDASGRVFSDQEDRRMYLHWRRSIKKLSGVLKWDMTQISPAQFRLDKLLINETQVIGRNNSSTSGRHQYNSGLPKCNLWSSAPANKILKMHQRAATLQKLDYELIGLERLRGKKELKKQLFADLATAHFEAKAAKKPFDARRIRKQIRKKLKEVGAKDEYATG